MRTTTKFVSIVIALTTSACSNGFVSLDGAVNGSKVNGNAFWGGAHIVFTDSEMECQDFSWVKSSYGSSDQVLLKSTNSFAALQISFSSSDVVEGQSGIVPNGPPTNAWFLDATQGDASFSRANSGHVDVEIDGDWLVGELDVDFGEPGNLSGDFEIQSCVNLK